MDSCSFKNLKVSRGYNYRYYHTEPRTGINVSVIFIHGWPATARCWRHIVPFFEQRGFGVIVPDMLGYGGTDKPTDHHQYQFSLITQDLVDILDAEGVDHAIAVGHDWCVYLLFFSVR